LIKEEGINQAKLAKKLGISTSYLTEIMTGRIKKAGDKFWYSLQTEFPGWYDFVRGTVLPPEDYKKGARVDDLPPARPDPYAETPEHMVGRRKPPPGERVPGSYGVPELGHKVTKIYQPMTHEELIEMFKDKELAKELNELLLKIERLDPDEFRCIHGYLYGKVQTLERIKKNHNHS